MNLPHNEAFDAHWQDARDSLADDLFQKLGRDPSAGEIHAYACDERISDRVAQIRNGS